MQRYSTLHHFISRIIHAICSFFQLHKYQSWMLKGHRTCNCLKEYEPDVLTYWANGGLKIQFYNESIYKIIGAFAAQKFCSFWKPVFSLNIKAREPKIQPITKSLKLFRCLESIRVEIEWCLLCASRMKTITSAKITLYGCVGKWCKEIIVIVDLGRGMWKMNQ